MRVLPVLLLVALLLPAVPLMLVPTAEAQGTPAGIRVMEDPRGDVVLENPSGTPVPLEQDRLAPLDILAVDVLEEKDAFVVTLWIAAFPTEPEVTFVDGAFHHILFRHADKAYAIGFQIFGGQASSWLEADQGSGMFEDLQPLALTTDPAAGRLAATIPRTMVADSDGAPPFPGRSLEQFSALSRGAGSAGLAVTPGVGLGGTYGKDTAAATDGFALPIQHGVRQDGHAQLSAARPFRASNGEEATFAFEVAAVNLDSASRRFDLAATNVPAGWTVEFPEPSIVLDAGGSLPLQVLAHVPFSHEHGRLAAFTVELRDAEDAGSVGRAELGLHYTDPAQPSGHHPTLYLHSHTMDDLSTVIGTVLAGQGASATMNTKQEDLGDDAVDVAGTFGTIDDSLTRYSFYWIVPLSPQLAMGLDVDLSAIGSVSVPLATTLPMPKARLDGTVYAGALTLSRFSQDWEGATVVATIPPTSDVDVAAAGSHLFQSTVVPSRAADYLPYDPEANLVLLLNVSFERPALLTGPEAPVLQPGGSLTLPLLEYADRVPRRSVVPEGEAAAAPADGATEAKGAPAPPAGLLAFAIGLAALALARRRGSR